jgi:D-alanyl-D-alanine carboxypeptidase (penicillin-binding protein 5/6)
MFDYGFANYTATPVVEKDVPMEQTVNVAGGKSKQLKVYPERSSYSFTRRGEKENISIDVRFDKVKAPISQSEKVGELIVYRDGVELERINLLATCTVEKATIFDRLREIAQEWNG